jgi:FkbM family methyltransferase
VTLPDKVKVPTGGRVVWGGRFGSRVLGSLDGWNCPRARLSAALEVAGELVVLDALSFPWELLHEQNSDAPLVVALPGSLSARELSMVLGDPLFSVLTPFDRLIESRPAVRSALQERWGLDEQVWISAEDASIDGVMTALSERSASRMVDVATAFGTFRGQADDVVTGHLQDYGAHQRSALNVLLAVVRDNDVIVDVGAHIGTLAIPLATRLSDRGHVFAVEGSSSTARLLRFNVASNHVEQRVTVVEAVLGRAHRTRFRQHQFAGNTGATSFLGADWFDREAVVGTSLDALTASYPELDGVTLLKVDVEGAELAVLEGATELIACARPLIVCEVSQSPLDRYGSSVDELDAWLAGADYKLELIDGPRNSAETSWQLTPLARLSDSPESHFDVLAVPGESERLAHLGREGSV